MIQRLREEIEQMDVNLIRFSVRTESHEFIKKIKEFSIDQETSNLNEKPIKPEKKIFFAKVFLSIL